jgi:hypothetical protein
MQVISSACRRVAMVASLLAVLVACVTETTTQSFRVVKNRSVEAGYIAVDADFSKYSRLLGRDMGIFYPSGVPLSEPDIQRIRQIFRTAFLDQLAGYEIVTEPGPDVMAVEASLIDMRSGTYQDVPGMRVELGDIAQPGELVFLMELKDSQTGRVLARAADSARSPTIATGGGTTTDWQSVEDAASHWATLFRRFLDDNLGR